jgi:hypothetical protein
MKGEDVRRLHGVLNFHLPPPSDQLPISGDGAFDFGPRTEEKVKEFQRINRIDADASDFPDGKVGPHTRAVLQSGAKVVVRVGLDPTELPKPRPPVPGQRPPLMPLLKPPLLMPPTPQQPSFIPVPKLHLDNLQVQSGFSHTINFTRQDTDSIFLQAQYTFLWRRDGPHTEITFGATHMFTANGKKEGNDIQIFGQVSAADIPIFDNVTASLFGQIAVQNLLPLNSFQPVVGIGAGVQFGWDIVKDRFSLAAQGMPFLNLLEEDRRFKVLAGFQGQGLLIFKFDIGSRLGFFF